MNNQRNNVIEIYQNILSEYSDITYKDILNMVSIRSSVPLIYVNRIVTDFRAKKSALSSSIMKKMLMETISDFHKNKIRQVVHTFWYNREFPTLQKVLRAVADDEVLCTLKQTSMYRILKALKFSFTGKSINCILMDKLTIWRHKYLKDLKNYRKEGRKIYYLGEMWYDVNNELPPNYRINHYKRDVPLMAAFIGSNTGFVDDSLMIFEPEIKNSDYHQEFDSDIFFAWFVKVLSLLDDNSVIVMNDSPYHYFKKEKFPTIMWKKEEIIQWFKSKNIPISTDDIELKAELLKKAKLYKKENEKCIVEEQAKAQNKTVLRLPPYHTNLNPIESVWLIAKRSVTNSLSKSNKIKFNKNIFVNAMSRITPKNWLTSIESTEATEQFFWNIDSNVDEMMETIDTRIYDIGNLSSDSDE